MLLSLPPLFLLSASMQIYSTRDLEDNLNKIREVCSDDKHDWDQRANAVSRLAFSSFFSFATITSRLFFFLWHCNDSVSPIGPFMASVVYCSQLKKIRSLLVAGAANYDCFYQHLRLLDGAFKLSAKDLRSQVVREACITVAWVSMFSHIHP